jgi:hypothetical protein
MQSFKKFKFLVVFEIRSKFLVLQTYPLKMNLILEIRIDPQIDREILS